MASAAPTEARRRTKRSCQTCDGVQVLSCNGVDEMWMVICASFSPVWFCVCCECKAWFANVVELFGLVWSCYGNIPLHSFILLAFVFTYRVNLNWLVVPFSLIPCKFCNGNIFLFHSLVCLRSYTLHLVSQNWSALCLV